MGKVLEESLKYLGVEPQYSADEMIAADIVTPELVGKSIADAQRELKNLSIKSKVEGNGDTITDQIPKPGAKMPVGSTVLLYTGDAKPQMEVTVPSVVGLTPEEATDAITSLGLNIRITGTKLNENIRATKQSPAKDSVLELGGVVTVEFIDTSEAIE